MKGTSVVIILASIRPDFLLTTFSLTFPQVLKPSSHRSQCNLAFNLFQNVDVVSDDDDDDDDDIIALTPISSESNKMASLEKMVFLIALLVEKSRKSEDTLIHLSEQDKHSLIGSGGMRALFVAASNADGSGGSGNPVSTSGKSLVFLYNVIKDNINAIQTCNLIFSLTRNNPALAEQVANMVFHGVKQPDYSLHFFRMLTLLTDIVGSQGSGGGGGTQGGGGSGDGVSPSGMPCFTSLVMHKVRKTVHVL
jgi:hypothetical protein